MWRTELQRVFSPAMHRFLALIPLVSATATVTVSNVLPRLDVHGKIVNAHDSGVVQDPDTGTYWL